MKFEKERENKKNKRNKKPFSEDVHFVLCFIVMCLLFVVSVSLSIIDKCFCIVQYPDEFNNVMGISSQIITAVIALVVSIIGIAISLQNEECFGIKLTKLYSLRVEKHFSILKIIIISILLCIFNMAFYMLRLYIAGIGIFVIAIVFLIQVVLSEVPIMSKTENALLKILINNLHDCYLKDKEASKDLKDAVRYLLYNKNLKEVYDIFKTPGDDEYNTYLIIKLLEYQHDLAFEINIKYDENEQRNIASSLLDNVVDVILRHIDISDEAYSRICMNKYLITRVLFRIHELPSIQKCWLDKVQWLFQYLSFSLKNTGQVNGLISEIIIILVSETVKHDDFSIIKSIRRQLSTSETCLEEYNPALDTFAILSMFLYYLSCSEEDVPDELKNKVLDFINESGIEEDTAITSWKELFKRATSSFRVDYSRFMSLSLKLSFDMEYYLRGFGAKNVVIGEFYCSNWFFTNWFNTQNFYDYNFVDFCTTYPEAKNYLVGFGRKCLNENGDFVPSDEMNRIVRFYDDSEELFVFFTINEEREHNYFIFVNNILGEQLSEKVAKAELVNNDELATKIRADIEKTVTSEWGFDSTIPIDNQSRYFSIEFEKVPEAINFEESVSEYCTQSVLSDLEKNVKSTVLIKDNNFENGINKILEKKPKYISTSAKQAIHYFISDERIKDKFVHACASMSELESKLLSNMFIMIGDSMRFNFVLQKVEVTALSDDAVSKKVASFQRADGQFVYEGVFLPRETVLEIVRKRFVVITIIMKHQVISSEESIYTLKPYSKYMAD